jgi:hypothetical protein
MFLIIAHTVVFGQKAPINNTQQKSMLPPSKYSASNSAKVHEVKILTPTRGQQVPVGKNLTISGISSRGGNITGTSSTNDCKVSVRINKVGPYQSAIPAGGGAAKAANYSKWTFVLTPKYTAIKPGQNRITAKHECINYPPLRAFSSVNVTGVPVIVPPNKQIVQKKNLTANNVIPVMNRNENSIKAKEINTDEHSIVGNTKASEDSDGKSTSHDSSTTKSKTHHTSIKSKTSKSKTMLTDKHDSKRSHGDDKSNKAKVSKHRFDPFDFPIFH